jgi:acetyl esterase/lipase
MAAIGRAKVISGDYRMPPEAYFPAALDDGMTVWKATLKNSDPQRIALFGPLRRRAFGAQGQAGA